jgi:hypothetical protein
MAPPHHLRGTGRGTDCSWHGLQQMRRETGNVAAKYKSDGKDILLLRSLPKRTGSRTD